MNAKDIIMGLVEGFRPNSEYLNKWYRFSTGGGNAMTFKILSYEDGTCTLEDAQGKQYPGEDTAHIQNLIDAKVARLIMDPVNTELHPTTAGGFKR